MTLPEGQEELEEKITIRVPGEYLEALDLLVSLRDSSSRSEAIRLAIRDYIYARVPMMNETIKRMGEARRAFGEMQRVKDEYLKK
jgi:metal-responsive CopG/Arc/MetJ family transcriptional regulator